MLAVLRELERKYETEVVVVGVHSPKFPAERLLINLRPAVRRLRIDHPVVNDPEFRLWQAYAVQAWPTLMFLDPTGKVIGKHEGEIPLNALDRLVGEIVQEFDRKNLLDRRPQLFRELLADGNGLLSFPGKVLADPAGGRLLIADTGHHRIVVAGMDGRIRQVIGDGVPGLRDGDFATSRFDSPEGMTLLGESLLVADTENHSVRRVALDSGRVETVAGTGEQGMARTRRGAAREVAMSSPWDLVVFEGVVYIAMAGFHQVWAYDPAAETVQVFAGTGHEGIKDGPRDSAWLAQPAGLAVDDGRLYVADSESSALRWIDLGQEGQCGTVAGLGLLEFGDVDGAGARVRLQHPLGVIAADGVLFVADTYNHKVKRVLPRSREVVTFAGSREPGERNGVGPTARFHEPGGICAADGRLYVADTDNHAIRVVDLETAEVITLDIQ